MSRNIFSKWQACAPYFQSMLRIVAGFMFMTAGTSKLFAFSAGIPPNGDTVKLMSQLGLAGILETFGGFLLLIGLFTRPIAFLVSGEMAVAFFQIHFHQCSTVLSGSTFQQPAQGLGVWMRN